MLFADSHISKTHLLLVSVLQLLLAAPPLISCGASDSDCAGNGADQAGATADGYVRVSLLVASGGDRRAKSPDGGEDGDGREAGVNNENTIHDVMVLLYKGDGINAADAETVTIDQALYFPNVTREPNSALYSTPARFFKGLDTRSPCHVLVIANVGDLSSELSGKTLSAVRDHIVRKAWVAGKTMDTYDYFVMSSERDALLDFSSGNGTEREPFSVNVPIERVAARIDFNTENATALMADGTIKGYVYDVCDRTNTSTVIGKFVLTHVMPFNEMVAGSYLFKRVCTGTDGATGSLTGLAYLGDETDDASGRHATNYVVDPLWAGKAGTDDLGVQYLRCHTTAASALASGAYAGWGVREAVNSVTVGTETENYYILDYTLENTTPDNAKTYATGLYFRGKYYRDGQWDATTRRPKPGAAGEDKTYVCYLRHSDPDGDYADRPMLYGIVRNNIYRVSVEKVLEDARMSVTVNVRKWSAFRHVPVVM